jgi:hypothetical protein
MRIVHGIVYQLGIYNPLVLFLVVIAIAWLVRKSR